MIRIRRGSWRHCGDLFVQSFLTPTLLQCQYLSTVQLLLQLPIFQHSCFWWAQLQSFPMLTYQLKRPHIFKQKKTTHGCLDITARNGNLAMKLIFPNTPHKSTRWSLKHQTALDTGRLRINTDNHHDSEHVESAIDSRRSHQGHTVTCKQASALPSRMLSSRDCYLGDVCLSGKASQCHCL